MKMLSFENRSAPFIDVFKRTATSHGYDLLLTPPPVDDPAFEQFRSLYRHLSINPESFELACFQRYFAAQALTAPDERVVMADTDLLIAAAFRDLPGELRNFDRGLVGSVGVRNGEAEADISPHFSIWTGRLLRQFCEFLVETYRSQHDQLAMIYSARAAHTDRVAISDMTLLNLWVSDAGIPFLNSNALFDGVHIDHNISVTECSSHRFRKSLGRKAIRLSGNRISFATESNEMVNAAVIHLQGRYKLGANALARKKMINFDIISTYIAAGRIARGIIFK